MTPLLRQAGFTLLEFLVALVVLSFLLVGLGEGARYGLRASATQSGLVASRSEMDAVDRVLRRLLTAAEPGDVEEGPLLRGEPARLAFRSELPLAEAGVMRPVAEIALGVDAGGAMQLRWTPHLHARRFGQPPAPVTETLLRGVARVEFAYWRDGWQRTWQDAALPALIRIRIAFAPGDQRHWPDIVVAPARSQLE